MIKQLRQRWLPALLCGFAAAFTFFFFGPMDIYVGNKTEFLFTFGDFAGWLALFAAGAFLFFGALILFTPEPAYPVVFGLVFWLCVMGYVQGMFLNVGMGSLLTDDVGSPVNPAFAVFDTVLWVVTGIGCVIGAWFMKKHDSIRTAALVLLFVVCAMQLVGCVSAIPQLNETQAETVTETDTDTPQDGTQTPDTSDGTQTAGGETAAESGTEAETEPEMLYLTTAGLSDVAPGRNIVIFLVDRFDVSYYYDLLNYDADFFAPLTGFTCFPDNISRYSRTYPAVAGMITGIYNDFSGHAEDYFTNAYQNSPFLHDLRDNGYSIRLYTGDYYAYRDASELLGVADNITGTTGYVVNDPVTLAADMLALSAYRYLPTVLKTTVKVSSGTFTEVGQYTGDEPAFTISDYKTFAALKGGLTVNTTYGENAYIFIHLNGCHSPYHLDEDGDYTSSGNSLDASRGVFKMIYGYIDELKRLGLYEDSTIVITGDHPTPVDDYVEPDAPRLTCLFVKPAGKSTGKPVTSSAQVCEDNLIPTLVQSAGIGTKHSYGKSYFDVPEGENTERHHYFELTYENASSALVDFRVTGPGADFDNWEVIGHKDVGWLYK